MSSGYADNDNRFTRVYNEYQLEKRTQREECVIPDYDNRFACLKDPPVVRGDAGRFECLRSDNRFDCLVNDSYNRPQRNYRQSERVRAPYESVNERMKRYKEENRGANKEDRKNTKTISTPLPFDNKIDFPELGSSAIGCSIKATLDYKLPESNLPEIVLPEARSLLVASNKKIMTSLTLQNGKLIEKEVYEDGSEIPEIGNYIVKKPVYNSWASVLK